MILYWKWVKSLSDFVVIILYFNFVHGNNNTELIRSKNLWQLNRLVLANQLRYQMERINY